MNAKMPMEDNRIISEPRPEISNLKSQISNPPLNYAPRRRFSRLRRWLRPGSAGFFVLILALAGAGGWKVWKLRLAADERAFNERTEVNIWFTGVLFSKPPDARSLRHLERRRGIWSVYFRWSEESARSTPAVVRGRRLSHVREIGFDDKVDVDAWLKELVQPDTSFSGLTTLNLPHTHVTIAGLKELARTDSGLKMLASLDLTYTQVTDAGIVELARAGGGLTALSSLDLTYTKITDASLKALARSDCGLKALRTLNLFGAKVTDAGLKELARQDSGLAAITVLDLGMTQTTDLGLMELARVDGGLTALVTLGLRYARVTDAGVAALQKARPGLKIIRY
jgi:hypothetical protein